MPDPSPLVSIITPSFNMAGFIRATIDSVIAQDYPSIEHIVIDGGSMDGTLEILKDYSGRIEWISEGDDGQSDAINKGFRRANGEIVAWLNADDTYLPGAVSLAVHALFDQQADIVYGNSLVAYANGDEDQLVAPFPISASSLIAFWRHDASVPPQPSVFMRRSVLDQVGLLNPALHYMMDYDLWLRAFLNGAKFAYLNAILSRIVVHPDSKTGQGWLPFAQEGHRISCPHWRRLGLAFVLRARWEYALYLANIKHESLRQELFYGNQEDRDHRRTVLKHAIAAQPYLLLNRGVRSMLAEAVLGATAFSSLRQALKRGSE